MEQCFVTFESDFSGDDVLDESGNPLAPAGREIASLLHSSVAKIADKTTEPKQEDDFGWQLSCHIKRVKLRVHVICSVKWGVYFEVVPGLFIPFHWWNGKKAKGILHKAIDHALQNDTRFRLVEWHDSKDEYDDNLIS